MRSPKSRIFAGSLTFLLALVFVIQSTHAQYPQSQRTLEQYQSELGKLTFRAQITNPPDESIEVLLPGLLLTDRKEEQIKKQYACILRQVDTLLDYAKSELNLEETKKLQIGNLGIYLLDRSSRKYQDYFNEEVKSITNKKDDKIRDLMTKLSSQNQAPNMETLKLAAAEMQLKLIRDLQTWPSVNYFGTNNDGFEPIRGVDVLGGANRYENASAIETLVDSLYTEWGARNLEKRQASRRILLDEAIRNGASAQEIEQLERDLLNDQKEIDDKRSPQRVGPEWYGQSMKALMIQYGAWKSFLMNDQSPAGSMVKFPEADLLTNERDSEALHAKLGSLQFNGTLVDYQKRVEVLLNSQLLPALNRVLSKNVPRELLFRVELDENGHCHVFEDKGIKQLFQMALEVDTELQKAPGKIISALTKSLLAKKEAQLKGY